MEDESGSNAKEALQPQQLLAIEELLAGATDGEAALAIGADRSTVWRWRHRSPAFRRELERRQEARRAAICSRAESLDRRALDLVAAAIRLGHFPSALGYLRLRGASALAGAIPKEDPSEVLAELRAQVAALGEAVRAEVPAETWERIEQRVRSLTVGSQDALPEEGE